MGWLAVLLFVGLSFFVFANRRTRIHAWVSFARQHGLNVDPGTGWLSWPSLGGAFEGVEVSIAVEVHGHGDGKTPYTVVHAGIDGVLPRGLVVSREGTLAKLGKWLGGQDIQVGDPSIDGALLIRGEIPSEVKRFFAAPCVGDAVLAALGAHGEAMVRDGRVRLVARGALTGGQLEALVRKATTGARQVSEAISGYAGRPPRVESAAPHIAPTPAAKGPFVTAPPPAPPPAPASPDGAAGAGLDPRLARLLDPALYSSEAEHIVRDLEGEVLSYELAVQRVERTPDLRIDAPLRDGRTVLGTIGRLDVALRVPASRNAEADGLGRGAAFRARGRAAAWEPLHRRLVVDAED